ncbi:MAG: PEGA domain-containing protein [Polyangiales bacterium]
MAVIMALGACVVVGIFMWSNRRAASHEVQSAPSVVIPSSDPAMSKIHVASSPVGALVYVGNEFYGNTPVTVSGIKDGAHEIRIRLPGFAEWSKSVETAPGSVEGILARLMPKQGGGEAGEFGYLSVGADEPAKVYLSGDLLGQTPIDRVVVPVGRLTLEFQLTDGTSEVRPVFVKAGSEVHTKL